MKRITAITAFVMTVTITTSIQPAALRADSINSTGLSDASATSLIDLGNGIILDTSTNLEWMKNMDLAGGLNWYAAENFISTLNAENYLGYKDWRLPTVSPVDGIAFNYNVGNQGNTDIGWGISSPASEWGHLFIGSLGNPSTGFRRPFL